MGYGKSTALKWWQQQLAARIPHAKIFRQLVAADSRQDFWDGFCRALRPRPVLAGQLQALGFPADPHTMRLLHELLQDALAGHPDPVFFILDDVHLLQSVDLPGIVSFLAERLPAQVHIVLLSRNQIFSAAAQLRLGSGLLTIGAADLRLRPEEICRYAACCRLPMTLSQAQALFAVSEGLAGHALSDVPRVLPDRRLAAGLPQRRHASSSRSCSTRWTSGGGCSCSKTA